MARPELRKRLAKHRTHLVRGVERRFECRFQVGSQQSKTEDGVVHLGNRQRSDARQVHAPPNMFSHHDLLPGRVAKEAVESGIVPQEHLRECGGEVSWLKCSNRLTDTVGLALVNERSLIEFLWERTDAGSVRSNEVEQRSSCAHSLVRASVRLSGLVDLLLGGVGSVSQATQGALGAGEQSHDLAAEETWRLEIGVGVESGDDFVECSDTGQAVAADEIVIEQRQRQPGHKGVNPNGQTGQFHGDVVLVHAVDTVPGDLAAQQRAGLDLDAGFEVAQRGEGGVS